MFLARLTRPHLTPQSTGDVLFFRPVLVSQLVWISFRFLQVCNHVSLQLDNNCALDHQINELINTNLLPLNLGFGFTASTYTMRWQSHQDFILLSSEWEIHIPSMVRFIWLFFLSDVFIFRWQKNCLIIYEITLQIQQTDICNQQFLSM